MAMVFGSESFERFSQSSWEKYVNNCRLPVIWFSRIYISIYSWWKYRYPWWLLAISQCDWVGYSDVPVIVCTMTWVGGGFPSTGCILPIRCLSTWSWLAFTDSEALIFLLARKLNPDVLLPYISPCCFERGVEWILLVPPLFQAYFYRIVGLCDTIIVSKWI